MIGFTHEAYQKMVADAVETFPDECCGFMLGHEMESNRLVQEIMVVHNAKEGDKRRRFLISARDYMQAERFADEKNLVLLGVYHSHPNHPPFPSEHDRIAAQPYFSYIIISIANKQLKAIRSWILNDDEQFEEEQTDFLKNTII